MLQVEGVGHAYVRREPLTVLSEVDLTLEEGEFVSIVGPSGCGKSTFLQILAGLIVPDRGEAHLDGETLIGSPGRTAYMPQRDLLLPWRRALDNATLAADIHGADHADSRARAAALFEQFGLAGFEESWPHELSGGMRQRLALLRTFLADRDLLLLDEPFGALDAITRRAMYGWLQDVWLADRRTVLFVTHDVEEALVLSDRVLVMSARPGTISHSVTVGEPRPRPIDDVTSAPFVARKAALLRALAESPGR